MRAVWIPLGLGLVALTVPGQALAQDNPTPSAPAAPAAEEPAPPAPGGPPTPVDPATATGPLVTGLSPDPSAPPLPEEAAEALAPEEPPAPPAPDISGWSYQDGALAGAQDARTAAGYGLHALGGLAAGLVCGACGCVGAPAVEMVVSPGVPAGPWQGYDSAYQRGYIDSYRRSMRQRRAAYAFAGAGVGATATFLVGFAYGYFGNSFDIF